MRPKSTRELQTVLGMCASMVTTPLPKGNRQYTKPPLDTDTKHRRARNKKARKSRRKNRRK